jgi:hypothetical protein
MIDFSQFAFVENSDSDKLLKHHKIDIKNNVEISSNCGSTNVPFGLREIFCDSESTENALRLIIVGHNPSFKSWNKGHYYANPSNRMWHLLTTSGIVPSHFSSFNDIDCPSACGIGFTDLMVTEAGVVDSVSSNFSDGDVRQFKQSLFSRLTKHTERVGQQWQKKTTSSLPLPASSLENEGFHPRVIAFAGVRQFRALFPTHSRPGPIKSLSKKRKLQSEEGGSEDCLEYGVQHTLPPDWPPSLRKSVVFLLPSSSAAAALVPYFF